MIDSEHSEYSARLEQWQRCRDCIEGDDAIKAGGTIYLPKLTLQTDDEYEAYKDRASFNGFTRRTHNGLLGMLFGKDPKITMAIQGGAGTILEGVVKDLDMRGSGLVTYARQVASEVLAVGRSGTWVDWNEAESRPYCAHFTAENILNWRTTRINGRMKLSMVIIREDVETQTEVTSIEVGSTAASLEDDPYELSIESTLRVLRLVREGEGHVYVVEKWQRVDSSSVGDRPEKVIGLTPARRKKKPRPEWTLIEVLRPTKLGQPIDEIPFIFHNPENTLANVGLPPLLDIANLNIDHYRLQADYRHGMHFSALPTAWVAGFPKDTTLRIGSSEAWVSENVEAKAGFLEFTGQGLGAFTVELERIEKNMAVVGARLLETQKKEAESGEALRLRQSGEQSNLQHIANVLSETMTEALRWCAWWVDVGSERGDYDENLIAVSVNRDFIDAKMPSQDLLNLVSVWLQGGISRKTLFWNTEQGELLPPGTTFEDEVAAIEADQASMMESRKMDLEMQRDVNGNPNDGSQGGDQGE